jgi:predicted transcriptional regulator YdeE
MQLVATARGSAPRVGQTTRRIERIEVHGAEARNARGRNCPWYWRCYVERSGGKSCKGKIAGLSTRFYKDDLLQKIPGKKSPPVPLAVYTDYESDHTGQYRLIAGAAVDAGVSTPDGMLRATIPAGNYLLFEAEGDMPNVVIETWKTVWSHFSEPSRHVRAYATDFEIYPARRSVEIYISIK